MAFEMCIKHPAGRTLAMIREEYVGICEGFKYATCAAAILNLFEFLTSSKIEIVKQAEIQNAIAAKAGLPADQDTELWVYKSQPNIKAETFNLFGETQIAKSLQYLVQRGFLQTRRNPKFRWDKTMQYLFDIETVQAAVDAWDRTNVPCRTSTASKPYEHDIEPVHKRDGSRTGTESHIDHYKEITIETQKRISAVPSENAGDGSTPEKVSSSKQKQGASHSNPPTKAKQNPSPVPSNPSPVPSNPSPRPHDPMFDAVCEHIFGISDPVELKALNEAEGAGARIQVVSQWLQRKRDRYRKGRSKGETVVGFISRPAEPEHTRQFADDWKRDHPNADVPRDLETFVLRWREWASKQNHTPKTDDITPVGGWASAPSIEVREALLRRSGSQRPDTGIASIKSAVHAVAPADGSPAIEELEHEPV